MLTPVVFTISALAKSVPRLPEIPQDFVIIPSAPSPLPPSSTSQDGVITSATQPRKKDVENTERILHGNGPEIVEESGKDIHVECTEPNSQKIVKEKDIGVEFADNLESHDVQEDDVESAATDNKDSLVQERHKNRAEESIQSDMKVDSIQTGHKNKDSNYTKLDSKLDPKKKEVRHKNDCEITDDDIAEVENNETQVNKEESREQVSVEYSKEQDDSILPKTESQSIMGSQSQTISSSQGKVYKMKRKSKGAMRKKRKPSDIVCPLPGSKYDVESWLQHCSESSLEGALAGETTKECEDKGNVSSSEIHMDDQISPEAKSSCAIDKKSDEMTEYTKVKRKRKKPSDTGSIGSTVSSRTKQTHKKPNDTASVASSRSTRSMTQAKKAVKLQGKETKKGQKGKVGSESKTGLKKEKELVEKMDKKKAVSEKHLFAKCVFSDGEKENSLDSFDVPSRQSKNSQDTIKSDDQEVEAKPKSRLKLKRATADLDFTSGSPRKKQRKDFDVEYSPTHDGKKPMQRKQVQTKLTFHRTKPSLKDESQPLRSLSKESGISDHIPEEISNQLKGLHEERLKLDQFHSNEDYKAYIEEQDRLLALKLQADFDFEARFQLNAIRRKGSEEEYQLRRGKRKTNYAQFFSSDTGIASGRPSRGKRK